ncbi:MAG: hypothetical protein WBB64_05455 [Anaerolineales bacterium]
MNIKNPTYKLIAVLFFLARLIFFVASPYDIVPGYGDYWNFYNQAQLGIPFLHFWTEFPPVFPFISRMIFLLVNGSETAYSYVLALVISLFQAGTIAIFFHLEEKLHLEKKGVSKGWVYFALVVGLFYSWSYFDPIAVFFLLLSISLLLDGKDNPAALAIAAGVLTKWFPILVIPVLWKVRSIKKAFKLTMLVTIIVILVWGTLYIVNPDLTGASLMSQINKGSWETIWALLDKNIGTGNFNQEINRQIPASANLVTGNPSLIPSWLTLIIFGGFGLGLLVRSKEHSDRWVFSFIGLSFVIFFLWSPGYSPQWILYLLPFILLCLPGNEAYLLGAAMVLVNLLEWPVLLSRGYFWSLYLLIPLRTLLMILMGVRLYQRSNGYFEKKDG